MSAALARERAHERVEPAGALVVGGEVVAERLLGPGARGRLERALGDLAADAAGVLAHRLQRPALHPAGHREPCRARPRARRAAAALADGDEDQRDVLDRPPGRARDGDDRRRVHEPRPQRVRRRQALGHAGRDEPRRRSPGARGGAPRRRARGAAAASRAKPSRPASIVSPRSPEEPLGEVPAGDRVDERVDAGHQLDLHRRARSAPRGSRSPPSRPRRPSPRGRSGRRARPRPGARRARRRAGRRTPTRAR